MGIASRTSPSVAKHLRIALYRFSPGRRNMLLLQPSNCVRVGLTQASFRTVCGHYSGRQGRARRGERCLHASLVRVSNLCVVPPRQKVAITRPWGSDLPPRYSGYVSCLWISREHTFRGSWKLCHFLCGPSPPTGMLAFSPVPLQSVLREYWLCKTMSTIQPLSTSRSVSISYVTVTSTPFANWTSLGARKPLF